MFPDHRDLLDVVKVMDEKSGILRIAPISRP
jgi:hypothetical protein